jgi:hypothetical protein
MSGLSEVSRLFAQRAGDIEKAREIFTAETRSYVSTILNGIQRARTDPWVCGRIRIDLPREIESEARSGYVSSQYAIARAVLRFKKGVTFQQVADVRFGIEYDQPSEAFTWSVTLVPASRYQRLDDVIWRQLKLANIELPGTVHQERANTVRFVQRALSDLTPEAAFNDVKVVLEFILTADAALAEAIGVDSGPGEEVGSV